MSDENWLDRLNRLLRPPGDRSRRPIALGDGQAASPHAVLEEDLRQLKEINFRLDRKVEAKLSRIRELESQLEEQRRSMELLEGQAVEANARETGHAEIVQQLAACEAEHEEMRATLEQRDRELGEARELVERKVAELETREALIGEREARLAEVTHERDAAREELEALREQRDALLCRVNESDSSQRGQDRALERLFGPDGPTLLAELSGDGGDPDPVHH